MMGYEPKDMTGSLFRNDRKEADTHPDYKGSALLGGVDHWMDAWINTDRNGNKYMSVKFKAKDQAAFGSGTGPARAQTPAPGSYTTADLDDDEIPF